MGNRNGIFAHYPGSASAGAPLASDTPARLGRRGNPAGASRRRTAWIGGAGWGWGAPQERPGAQASSKGPQGPQGNGRRQEPLPSLALNFLADRHAVRPTPRLALAIDHELTEEGPRDTLHHRGAQQYDFISSDTHLEVLPEYVAIELREHLEVEHIMFATDFPHIECEWPNTRPTLDRLTASLAPAEKYSIVAGNVIDYFQLDPAKFVVRGEDEGRTEIMGTTRDGNYPH